MYLHFYPVKNSLCYSNRISFKEKRVTAAENMKNYKTCDELTGEISELKTKRRELEAELTEG